jgi:tetratricopeptide (TPR) repeat protein
MKQAAARQYAGQRQERIAMKKVVAALLMTLVATLGFAENTTAAKPSPAEQAITVAEKQIAKSAKNFEAYNALALAQARRARETSDVSFYAKAEESLQKSFQISPGNFDGSRIQVWLLLGRHEFGAALEAAKALNQKMPDDVMTYGFLTDANVELGNYKDAETSAQWMLNLRPGNLPAVTRTAYLRELFGDLDGALELMDMAYQSTPPSEAEDGAWILTQMAHLKVMQGNPKEAEKYLQEALAMFPGYHYALGTLSKVRIEQKRYEEAVTLLKQRYQAAPHAENLYDLAEALALAGHKEEAQKAFTEFEAKSLLETGRADNSNHELTFYYADHAHQPAKALEVAAREYARRHDVNTLDAYAWALHVNGNDVEARKQIEKALAVGVQDARFFRHAGEIALKIGDRAAAKKYLEDAAKLNSPGSEQARVLLASIGHASASR